MEWVLIIIDIGCGGGGGGGGGVATRLVWMGGATMMELGVLFDGCRFMGRLGQRAAMTLLCNELAVAGITISVSCCSST